MIVNENAVVKHITYSCA